MLHVYPWPQGGNVYWFIFSWLTFVSFRLPPQEMTALICSQAVNCWALRDPTLALARNSHSPGHAPLSCSHLWPVWLMWLLFEFQTMTAPTPSRPTKWPGCTATWTSSIRAGSPRRNRRLLRLPPRSWLAPPLLSPWSGFRPSMATSLKGDHALLCTLALNWMERAEIGEQPGAPPAVQRYHVLCSVWIKALS